MPAHYPIFEQTRRHFSKAKKEPSQSRSLDTRYLNGGALLHDIIPHPNIKDEDVNINKKQENLRQRIRERDDLQDELNLQLAILTSLRERESRGSDEEKEIANLWQICKELETRRDILSKNIGRLSIEVFPFFSISHRFDLNFVYFFFFHFL